MKRIDWRTELGAIPHVVPQGLSDSSVPQGLLDTAVPQGLWEEYTLTNHAVCKSGVLKVKNCCHRQTPDRQTPDRQTPDGQTESSRRQYTA